MQANAYNIDNNLIKEAMQSTGLSQESAVIEQGLKLLIALSAQQNLRNMRGKLPWDGDLAELQSFNYAKVTM